MDEYKGIYYGEDSDRKYFEGGAHFKYLHLYKVLDKLSKEQKKLELQSKSYEKKNMANLLLNVNNSFNIFFNFYIYIELSQI